MTDRALAIGTLTSSPFREKPIATLDSLLTELRKVVRDHGQDGFPLSEIEAAMARQGKSLRFEPEELEDLADMEFGNRRLFPLLALLYPGVDVRNEFHIDHVFPKSKLTEARLRSAGLDDDAVADARYYANTIANLQLLEGPLNEAKLAKLPRESANERSTTSTVCLQAWRTSRHSRISGAARSAVRGGID